MLEMRMRISNTTKGIAEFEAFKKLLEEQNEFEIIQISQPYADTRTGSKTSRVYIKLEKK